MKYGTLFSGVEGFGIGFDAAGMVAAFQCEIDEQCQQVLAYRYPGVPKWSNVKEVHGDELPDVDVLAFGSPCQDLSVAGRREGLDGERSGLFIDAIRIADSIAPDWLVFENVPGVLSSQRGEDFAVVLEGVTGFRPSVPCGGWRDAGVCLGPLRWCVWRVLDTQFFGPPQRRRRVFLVGGSRAPCRPEVLLEPEGLPWSPAPSREAREGVARGVEGGAGEVGGVSAFTEISARKWVPSSGTWLAAHEAKEPHTLVVSDPVAFDTTQVASKASLAFHPRQDPISGPTAGCEAKGPWAVGTPAPRRLTPRECERLQGWPDDWTRYGRTLDGEVIELADTPRYRMCGNGVSAPVAEWIARRILAADGPQP